MKKLFLFTLFNLYAFTCLFAFTIDKGLIIYSATAKHAASQDVSGLGRKQPDSIFYSVYFEKDFSISYFALTSKIYPKDFEFSDLDQYSLNFMDSNFSIRKNILCNTKYKSSFQQKRFINTGESVIRSGFRCNKYFTVGRFNDTTYYFITKGLPKSAGFKIETGIAGCILEIESNLYKIFPVVIDSLVYYNTESLRKTPCNLQTIESSNKLWIESPVGEIIKGKVFPRFYATNIQQQVLTDADIKAGKGSCSIILLLDFINFCKDYSPSIAGHYVNSDKQSKEILEALDKVAAENRTKYFVITKDYWENIKNVNYENLQIIPNAEEWYERTMVFAYPLFVIVDDEGIVKDFISLFQVDYSRNYIDGFEKLVKKCAGNQQF